MHCLTYLMHLQKSVDTEMECYIIKLDFSAPFDRSSESLRSLIQIDVCWCRWQCAVHL